MKKIFLSGHNGMVGSALIRAFNSWKEEFEIITQTRAELDLCNQSAVAEFFSREKPELVINAAGRVGGIFANNTYPAEFIRENLLINSNLIHSSFESGVARFLNLGSSCIYPRNAEQPLLEKSLLSGPLEPTNSAYAIAKIAGLEMCRHYRNQYGVLFHSAMPTNLYGPGDNYHHENSHVLPALIRRFHEAKLASSPAVTIWGTGKPKRELLHADDLADALIFLLSIDNPPDWVNIGSGKDQSILELATIVKSAIGFDGEIEHDLNKPDGAPIKRLDVTLMEELGWKARISLVDGIESTYGEFLRTEKDGTLRI